MFFCNIDFKILSNKDLFVLEADAPKCVVPTNAQVIVLANTNERLLHFINRAYPTFDGQIPLLCAEKKNKIKIDKISGSDIVYDFCGYAKRNNLKVFFLGGKQDSNTAAVEKIKNDYDITIAGYSPDYETYPFSDRFVYNCRERIFAFKPDIVFVGFGAPKQEFFVEDNFEFFKLIGVKYVICAGGTFEFVSGKIKRAPVVISKIGLESIYRFCKEISWMRLKRILYSFKFFRYM